MTREQVLQRLRAMLVEDFQVPADRLVEDAHLGVDFQLDSLALVDLMLLVQREFGFKAGAEEFRNARTLGTLADFIAARAKR